MNKIILVAGGTGNLGERIIKALMERGATVRAVVRMETAPQRVEKLQQLGAIVLPVDMQSVAALTAACANVSCVISALAGLKEVIIDTQKILLEATVAAGVPRFIPSDFSLDFTPFSHGENRNLDWRREFHTYLDKSPIAATSIFNGGFTELLTDEMPTVFRKQKLVLYWGNADHKLTFTTIGDTAIYTAHAALDDSSPRFLHIAGDQISAREISNTMTALTGKKFRLVRAGGPKLLSALIKIIRTMSPAPNELYPPWQGMQYMRNMIDERSKLPKLDNDRYPNLYWTTAKEILA